MNNRFKILISIFLVSIIVMFSFYPAIKNGFVNWDDGKYLVDNLLVKDLSIANFNKILSSFHFSNYQPLTLFSYAIEYQLFKLDPFWYHLDNLILHLLNSILVFWLIFLIAKNIWVAFVTSILFGIHPLHVESVAWISGRKDVLYGFFYLSASISYIYFLSSIKKAKYYIITLLFFIFSVFSKSAAITLLPILFLFDYICNRKYSKRALLDKIPFAIIAFVFSVVAILSQAGAVRKDIALSLFSKLKVASYCIIFYLEKIFLPVKLSCFYPPFKITDDFMPNIFNYSFALLVILIIIVCFTLKYTKKIMFGVLFFLISIFLNLQFIPLGVVLTADRYTYIPALGIFFIFAVFFMWLIKKVANKFILKAFLVSILIFIIVSFTCFTWNRCKVWKNGFTLWSDVISKYKGVNIAPAYFNRGLIYLENNKLELAYLDLKESLVCMYNWLGSKNNQSVIYQKLNKDNENYGLLLNLASKELAEVGLKDLAIVLFKKLIIKKIFYSEVGYLEMCVFYRNLKRYQDSIFFGKQAIKINHCFKDGYYNLAKTYYLEKKYELAKLHLRIALKLEFK